MVTTPTFHVSQDATWVFVHVRVPYVRVSEMEFYVDGMDFTFYCKPYGLKLQFPHEVVDNELTKAVYDPNKDNGTIVVHLAKKESGQNFPDLDMLTKLLQPQRPLVSASSSKTRTQQGKTSLIEVLESTEILSVGTHQEETDRLNALIDAKPIRYDENIAPSSAEQVHTDSSLLGLEASASTHHVSLPGDGAEGSVEMLGVHVTDLAPSYGFNNAYSDFFRVWHGEVSEILSLPDPEHTRPEQRRILREAAEDQQFDIERYLMDFAYQDEDMYFNLAMTYVPFWRKYPVLPTIARPKSIAVADTVKPLVAEVKSDVGCVEDSICSLSLDAPTPSAHSTTSVIFNDTEQELLRRLPRKEFLVLEGSLEEKFVLGGLVDILIGFAYEQLTTQGDSGVESTWTVSIVSPTLSWLDVSADLYAVVRSSVRRIIAFPFLRQYDLAMRSVREASEILKRGKRVVLRALLTLYRMVEKSETQYLLNSLYIQDYCVSIQSVADERLQCISSELDAHIAGFSKNETGWALEELERSVLKAGTNDDAESSASSESNSSESGYSSRETSSAADSSCGEEEVNQAFAPG